MNDSNLTAPLILVVSCHRFVFVPIVERLHWSLAVVCNLDCWEEYDAWEAEEDAMSAGSGGGGGDWSLSSPPRLPCVLFMDSLKMHDPNKVALNLNAWLKHEWRTKKAASSSSSFPPVDLFKLDVPRQDNPFDCGLFMLQNAQEVLQRSPNIYPANLESRTVEGFGPNMFSVNDMHVSSVVCRLNRPIFFVVACV